MTVLTALEKQVIQAIQGDMPVTARPYEEIARGLGVSESTLLAVLKGLCERGVIRRFGATIRHQLSGFRANAMVAWKVDEDRVDEVGESLSRFQEVTHCYRRTPTATWPYNLYTMVHARDEAACRATAANMAASVGLASYILLFSRRELKKTSMEYFPSDLDD